MLQILNDDCLRLILTNLDLNDKIILANTCQHLRDTIKDHFRVYKPICLDENVWHHLLRFESKPEEFLNCISKNVHEIQFNAMNRMQFKTARNCQFPQLKSLKIEDLRIITEMGIKDIYIEIVKSVCQNLEKFSFMNSSWRNLYILSSFEFPKVKQLTLYGKREVLDTSRDNAENLEKIANIFPNLTKLILIAPETAINFHKLTNLIELEIILKTNLCLSYLVYTFESLNLKKLIISKWAINCIDEIFAVDSYCFISACVKLEFLQIDCHVLRFLAPYFNELRRIRKFVFTYENLFFCQCGHEWMWNEICNLFTNRIEYLGINSYMLRKCSNIDAFFSICLPKLRRLVIFDKYCTEHGVKHLDLLQRIKLDEGISKHLINILGWRQSFVDLKNKILNKLRYCINLESFDVSANICDLEFLKSAILCIRLRNQEHYKPFTIRCFNTDITAKDLKNLFLPPGVQVLLKNELLDLTETDSFEIETTPILNE